MSGRPVHWIARAPGVAIGAALLLLIVAAALFAPLIAPHDPNAQDLLNPLLPPAWMSGGNGEFPLGTDSLGRCVLSRLFYGARVAVVVGTAAPIGAAMLGCVLALLAGYCGGGIDWAVSRGVDIWMSFPPVVLALILIVGLQPGVQNVILAIVLVDWTRFCRVIRSEAMVLAKYEYVAAARMAGATHLDVVLREIVPGVTPTVVTLLSTEIGIAVVAESILSFVGVSVPPQTPTWGAMVADGLTSVFEAPLGLLFPMISIAIVVFGANLLGDGLRRTYDPQLLADRSPS
jgi:peptide/nickel transport system permease protein